MTCLSCRWSISKDGKLVCQMWSAPADRICTYFEYEPGTDELP